MSLLTKLPAELIRLILDDLANTNLPSLFIARRTCKVFNAIVTDMLEKTPGNNGLAIYDFLKSNFFTVLDSSAAGPQYRPDTEQSWAPYAALPWVSNPATRAKYLREEASCRSIPLVSDSGRLVHCLQLVDAEQVYTAGCISSLNGGWVVFRFPDEAEETGLRDQFYFPQGISFGRIYDLLVPSTYSPRQEWRVVLETRVRDPEEFERFPQFLRSRDGPDSVNHKRIEELSVHDMEHAVVLIGTSTWWCHYEESEPRDELWQPEEIGHVGEAGYDICSFKWPLPVRFKSRPHSSPSF